MKIICVIPVFDDYQYFDTLLFQINAREFDKHLLILLPKNKSHLEQELNEKLSYLDYSIVKVNYSSESARAKIGLELAREWSKDYVAVFNEGYQDGLEVFLDLLETVDIKNYSVISSVRTPTQLNLGRILNVFNRLQVGASTLSLPRDLSGDSTYLLRVSDFDTKFSDPSFLPDSQHFFVHIYLFAFYKRLNVLFLEPVSLNRKSFYKYNLKSLFYTFFQSIKYIFLKSSILKKQSSIKTFLPEEFITHADSRVANNTNMLAVKKTSKEISELKGLSKQTQLLTLDQAKKKKSESFKLTHKNPRHSNQLIVNWCLTNICNYKCTYCPDNLHNGTQKGIDLKSAKEFVDKITKNYSDKEIHFELTGGEVTYYKGFKELIRYIKSLGHFVAIISNGARKIEFWEENLEFLDYIMLSFHSEQGEPEHFRNVAKFLCDKTDIHVNMMMKPENFDKCYELANNLVSDSNLSIALQPLLEGMDGKMFPYSDDQHKILNNQIFKPHSEPKIKVKKEYLSRGELVLHFKDNKKYYTHSPELISNGFNNWSGWNCNIGLETICVDFYGNLLRGWCGVGGIFGNINDYKIRFPKESILCNKKQCSCGQDIMTTKIKKETVSS